MFHIPKPKQLLVVLLTSFLGLSSCTEVECPLDTVVVMTCGLYDASSHSQLTLYDTLTVNAVGATVPLLNRAVGKQSFGLSVSYQNDVDTLLFCFSNAVGDAATDTIFLAHTNAPHFESVDCPTSMFHQLTRVAWTRREPTGQLRAIDSVAIVRSTVDYEDIENIRVFLRAAAQ